jgi:hypothetical protein
MAMFAQYDPVLLFLATNCGNIDNDQRCCPLNLKLCGLCSWWGGWVASLRLRAKLGVAVATGLNLMSLYILTYK